MPQQPRATAAIASQAFRAMEMAPFSSFADDTPQAQDAAEQYLIARRMCLEACDWSFASTVADLPLKIDGVGDRDLPFVYALPGNCVRLIHPVDTYVRWRVDGRLLRADAKGPLTVRYTADVEDETILPAVFQTAVALRLAALLSPRWVGSDTKTRALEDGAELHLKNAMRQDARSASAQRYDGMSWADYDLAGWATR